MQDQPTCSPCSLDVLLTLPSPDNDLLALGLPALSPQQRERNAAAPKQPSHGQRTPDMAMLNFEISEEEMEWLVALTDADIPACVGSGTPAAGAMAAAAEAASTSTTVTAPLPQQEAHQMRLDDLIVPGTAPTGLAASQAEAAAGAAEFGNNVAWIADAAAAPAGLAAPLPGDQLRLQELRLWSGEIQSALLFEQPHTPASSGTSSQGQRSGKPRRSPQSSLKRRGRQPAMKSAFQRDIELFTLRVQEEEAARHCPADPAPPLQPRQPVQPQPQQPQAALPTGGDEAQQQASCAAVPVVSAVAFATAPHQSLTALLASCLGAQRSQAACEQAAGPDAVHSARPAADGVTREAPAAAATAAAVADEAQSTGGIEVPIQIVQYQLEDCCHHADQKWTGGSNSNNLLGYVPQVACAEPA